MDIKKEGAMKNCKSHLAERFRRRMNRVKDSVGRKIVKYGDTVQPPTWNVLRDDYLGSFS